MAAATEKEAHCSELRKQQAMSSPPLNKSKSTEASSPSVSPPRGRGQDGAET